MYSYSVLSFSPTSRGGILIGQKVLVNISEKFSVKVQCVNTGDNRPHTQVVGKEINMPWEWNEPASPLTNDVHADQLWFGMTCLWLSPGSFLLQTPELKTSPEQVFCHGNMWLIFEPSLLLCISIIAPINLRIHTEYIPTKIVALWHDIWLLKKRIFLPIDPFHKTSYWTKACIPACITCSVTSFYFPCVYELIDLGFITKVLSICVTVLGVCVCVCAGSHVNRNLLKNHKNPKRSWLHRVNITCVPSPSVNHRVPISPNGPRSSPAALCWDLHHHPTLCSGGGGLPCLQVRAHTHYLNTFVVVGRVLQMYNDFKSGRKRVWVLIAVFRTPI